MLYNTKSKDCKIIGGLIVKKCILLYGFNNFQFEQVKKAFTMQNVEVKLIPKEQYGYLIGELIGEFPIADQHDEFDIQGKMAVISGVEGEEMARTFQILTQTTGKLSYHKAIVTDTNVRWTSSQLFIEVDREYRELRRKNRLKQ